MPIGLGMQVFGVFNSLIGTVVKNSVIEFDDDWEEKSNVAAMGSRLLRWRTQIAGFLLLSFSFFLLSFFSNLSFDLSID